MGIQWARLVVHVGEHGAAQRVGAADLGIIFMMSKVEVVVRRVAASASTDQCEDEERDSHHHLTWAAELH
jgi:hypothetical protein